MNNFILHNLSSIKNLELFLNLPETQLLEILSDTKIHNYKKGEMIFHAEEELLYFYIILSGTIKTFLTDINGKEAVLEIIDSGNFINNIFADNSQSNAQATEDSTIISIGLDRIRSHIKNNHNLIINLLKEVSKRNSNLLDHLAQIKLANSKQKVGQFLLGIAFGKGPDKKKNFELKYDKSLIASYLGMKPETLSRTLQELKNDGEIKVEKNKISLLQNNSLCEYCDSKIHGKCSNRDLHFCANK